MAERVIIPPVVTVSVEGGLDVMVASDSARHLADLRGFSPVYQAIVAGAVHALSQLVVRTHESHIIEIQGFRDETHQGLLVSCAVSWLSGISTEKILQSLESGLYGLVDEVAIVTTPVPTIEFFIWLIPERQQIRQGKLESEN